MKEEFTCNCIFESCALAANCRQRDQVCTPSRHVVLASLSSPTKVESMIFQIIKFNHKSIVQISLVFPKFVLGVCTRRAAWGRRD